MLFIFEAEIARPPGSDEPIREGSVFTTVNRGKEYVATFTTFESPTRLAFDVTGKRMDITALFSFAGSGEGTSLRGEFDLRPKGFVKVTLPLKSMVRRDQEKQSQNFKAFCEGG